MYVSQSIMYFVFMWLYIDRYVTYTLLVIVLPDTMIYIYSTLYFQDDDTKKHGRLICFSFHEQRPNAVNRPASYLIEI